MRWASSGVPVHLVPLSFQPHAPLSRLVLLSCLHSFVFCAHNVHIGPHLSFTPPLGEACVCNPCSHRDPDGLFSHRFSAFVFQQGGHPCAVSDGPTKRPQYMRISGLISQTYLPFSESSEWHEAKPRTSQVATFGSPERTSSCRLDRRLRS